MATRRVMIGLSYDVATVGGWSGAIDVSYASI